MGIFIDPKFTADPQTIFPLIRTADSKKKTKEYYKANMWSLYSEYYSGLSMIPYSKCTDFAQLRLFAAGEQDENFYKQYLSEQDYGTEAVIDPIIGHVGTKGKHAGYMRVFWDVMSPAQKIVNSVVDRCKAVGTDILADPIDQTSREEIEDAKIDAWAEKENKDFKKQYFGALGVDIEDPEYTPESRDELELYEALGGFKPTFARAMEKLIAHTEDVSGWDVITDMIYRDAVALGVMCIWDDYDPEDGKVKPDYTDPAWAGIQWSIYPDCRDSEYAFRFKSIPLSTLRQWFQDEDEEFFRKIAITYAGWSGNPVQADFVNYNKANAYGGWAYDFFKICVMEARWIDNEGKQNVITKNKYGKETVKEVDYDEDIKETENKIKMFTMKRFCYQCKWIVGTEFIYDWGKKYNQTFPTPKDAELGVHYYVFPGKSMIKQLIPVFHNFQVLWIRYLNALAQAINSGYEVNADSISNIQTGGDKDNKNDQNLWIRRFVDTGIAFVSNITPMGTREPGQAIRELRGGMGQMFADILLAFKFNLSLIESITGVNPLALGEQPDPNAPVGTSKLSLAAVSNILKYLVDGYLNVKKNMAACVTRHIQVLLRYNSFSRKAYKSVLGDLDMETLIASNRGSTEYAIRLQARPTDAEKQMIIQQLMEAQKNDRDGGSSGLTGLDAVILMRRIEAGTPMSQIEFEMESRKRKNIKEAEKRKADAMKQQAQLNDQNAQKAAQLKDASDEKAHKYKMDEIGAEGKNKIGDTVVKGAIKHGSEADCYKIGQ